MRRMRDYVSGRVPVILLVTAIIIFGAATVAKAEKQDGEGHLGVMVQPLPDGLEEELNADFGVLVTGVTEDGPAEKAGILKGDVIQYFNDEKIRRPSNLVDAVRESKPGSKAVVKIVRDGKKKEVTATIGELNIKKFDFDWKDGRDFKFEFKRRAYLGVGLQELNDDLAEYFDVKAGEGALVLTVEEDSPAQKAGVKSGDVIVKLGDAEVKGPEDAIKIISEMEKGETVELTVVRHKTKKTMKAELQDAKGFRGFNFLKMKDFPTGPSKGQWHNGIPRFRGYEFYFDDDEMGKRADEAREKTKKEGKKVKKELKVFADDNHI